MYRGEGFAEVGVGGGAVIEVRESFTRQGFLADPLTILLPEVRFVSLHYGAIPIKKLHYGN